MGELAGRTALITGAARGQGRAEALALAQRGCNIVLFDLCGQTAVVDYPLATPEDMAQTAEAVVQTGAGAIEVVADVRDYAALAGAARQAIERFSSVDFLIANAGIAPPSNPVHAIPEEAWREVIDINLTGVWNAMRAVLPHMIERGFGRIIATSSMAVRPSFPGAAHYTAAKAGILQLVRTAAIEYAPYGITCNALLPGVVNTPLMNNPLRYRQIAGGAVEGGSSHEYSLEDAMPGLLAMNAMPIPWIESEDVAEAVIYLCGESGRYVTGAELEISGGFGLTTFRP